MKNMLFKVFKVLIWIILVAKVLNWFLHFDDHINYLLNTAMFSLIGIAYVIMGVSWNNKMMSIVIVACGLFLLAMNFFPQHLAIEIVGIACILTPLIIARFSKNGVEKSPATNTPDGTR